MARWMDENFQKNFIGDEKVSDTLIELGKSYLAIKKIKELPEFAKKAFDLFKSTKSIKEKKILGFFEPQFFNIENSDQEKVDEWFEKYTNVCNGKDTVNLDHLPSALKPILNSTYSSINNFDEKEIFDDESDLISEKEAKKQKKNENADDSNESSTTDATTTSDNNSDSKENNENQKSA